MVQKFTIVPIAIFICKKIIMAKRNLIFESKIYKQKKLTLTTFDNHCNNIKQRNFYIKSKLCSKWVYNVNSE